MALRSFCHLAKSIVNPKVCIIGSGPGGFYVAYHLLKYLPNVKVDMFEKLPVPFGLVRYGVAPDHPDAKNVENTFTKTASNPNFSFHGNVYVGKDVDLKDFKEAYHAVVMSYGCSEERKLGIKGEDQMICARRIVGWYNGLPDDKDFNINLECDSAVIVGQGNVAIDIARILLTPVDLLKITDITDYALETLSKSRIKKVYIVARRGPLNTSFTIKEFRQMTRLPHVRTFFRPNDLIGLEELIPNLGRPKKRLMELFLNISSTPQLGHKDFCPIFFRRPLECSPKGIKFCVTRPKPSSQEAVEDTDEIEEIACQLKISSIGYKGVCIDQNLQFDDSKGIVIPQPGIYASGWISTGPIGVILSTMNHAFRQGSIIEKDFQTGKINSSEPKPGYEHIKSILVKKGIRTVSFEGWQKINQVELERGAKVGKRRQKIVDIEEMIEIGGE